jgi:hypothetical protein
MWKKNETNHAQINMYHMNQHAPLEFNTNEN